jgi:hypothetical protein
MSTQTPTPSSALGVVRWLSANRSAGGIGLAIAGAAILALPVWLLAQYQREFLSIVICTAMLGLLWLACGISLRFLGADPADVTPVRAIVLVTTGAGGLLIAATGFCLAYHWWSYLPAWLREDERAGLWHILVALVVLLGGLAVMFAGLQAAREEERTNPALRRLVFGYNAVLSGLLLLILLGILNAYVSARYATAFEAIDRGDTTLSERAQSVAKGLDRPVRFYVIWPTDDDLLYPLRTLLGNLEDASPQIRVTYLSPALDREAIADLARKYANKIQEGRGVLVVRGEEKPENATFLSVTDLYTQEGGRFGQQPQLKFKGEDRIVAALMTERAIVYITQGEGEPDLLDTDPRQLDKGLGALRERLNARGNMDVRPLRIEPADAKIPADASLVIVANPQPPVGAALLKALRSYLSDRKGKAVFLIDVPSKESGAKTMPPTGLEDLFAGFGVEVTNEVIYAGESIMMGRQLIPGRDFLLLQLAPEQARGELGRAFGSRSVLTKSARVVRAARGQANPMFRVEPFLTTRPGSRVWTETDLTVDPDQTLDQIESNPDVAKRRLSSVPLTAAVVVTESPPPSAAPEAMPPESKPRLVVIGDATLVSNGLVAEGSPFSNFALFASTLDWLTERPTSVGIGARSLKYYSLEPTANGATLILLPGLIAVVSILGLGLGVWVVRRR